MARAPLEPHLVPAHRRSRCGRVRAQPQEHHRRAAARQADRLHRPLRLGQVVAWRSTRSTPRASAATSSRCRPTPASSSARSTSRTSTSSRASRRPSPSTRSRPAATPARPSARSPRSTTTSACSMRGSAPALPEARQPGRPPDAQQIVDRVLLLPEGTQFQVLAPVVRGRKGEYETLFEDSRDRASCRARVDGEVVDIDEFLKRPERSPATSSTPSRSSSTASSCARASSAGSPTRWRRR